jgi:uncharacterized protein (DUF4415 family)
MSENTVQITVEVDGEMLDRMRKPGETDQDIIVEALRQFVEAKRAKKAAQEQKPSGT